MSKDENNPDNVLREYLAKLGSQGGKARAEKYDAKTLSKWAKLGGRPKKGTSKSKTKGTSK